MPLILALVIPILIAFIMLRIYYIKTARELKRIESIGMLSKIVVHEIENFKLMIFLNKYCFLYDLLVVIRPRYLLEINPNIFALGKFDLELCVMITFKVKK